MKKLTFLAALIVTIAGTAACSSTQKTEGQGMVSVVAQNVVRIAGKEAMADLDLSRANERRAYVDVTGFADAFSAGYIENLVRNRAEVDGGRLVTEANADIVIEVAVNAAGNDVGISSYVVGGSSRSEGTVDLTITLRDSRTGERISRQQVVGYAKYLLGTFLGISGSGAYFVLKNDSWEIVDDPSYY